MTDTLENMIAAAETFKLAAEQAQIAYEDRLKVAEVERERDEARAEVERLRAERDEARAEVERLRASLRSIAEGFGRIDGSWDDPSAKQVDGYYRGFAVAALEKKP